MTGWRDGRFAVKPWLWLAALFLLALAAPAAHADELRPGYLEFTQQDALQWALTWKAPIRGGLTPATQPILPEGCTANGKPNRRIYGGTATSYFTALCRDKVSGKSIGLSNMDGAQTDILVRIAPLNRPVQAARITAAAPTITITAKTDAWQLAKNYFVIGMEHIIQGYDHLLFVIALVLLIRGRWRVIGAVTAFTIAHSVTLIATILGLFRLPAQPVEAVIALSILFLASEIIKHDPSRPRLSERRPWLVAFIFGLLHGFGFAAALQDIGLPQDDVAAALLTFNLGVEAGQIAVVLLCLALLTAIKRFAEGLMRPAIVTAAYGIGITASYWLIARLL